LKSSLSSKTFAFQGGQVVNFKDKVFLVTGGGAGIGLAIAEAVGAMGASVVLAEVNAENLRTAGHALRAAGVEVTALQADVCVDAQVRAVMESVDRKFGKLDVLVNNVGCFRADWKPFADSTPDDWEDMHRLNFLHVLRVTHAAIPLLRLAAPGSSILSIASIEGLRGMPLGAAYAAYKAAVINFTKSLACELGPEGIRVNCIANESTETERISFFDPGRPDYLKEVSRFFPLGRYGRAKDVAGAAVYLSGGLAEWTTGETLVVDGGALAQAGWRQTMDGRWTNSPVIDTAHRMFGPADQGRR
jgi:NAD(P)-dependent dehydrogenase (short-subunit alcohol dehydrogenase family)